MVLTLNIPEEQVEGLDRLQQLRGLTREQLIQEALAAYLPQSEEGHPVEFFGLLRGRIEDGMAFQDRMRREWDRES